MKEKIKHGWNEHAFNRVVSDMISVERRLPEKRDSWCLNQSYGSLPQTSIIICFHNEAWSTLLRTVHSVLNRSPDHLVREILLVDDASTHEHLGDDLDDYMKRLRKVRIIRLSERSGLIRARLVGAGQAQSSVLTFLDSHCECMAGWLEPLVSRIVWDSSSVVCPVIDAISDDTFQYSFQHPAPVGGFSWDLRFRWQTVSRRESLRRPHSWAPLRN